MPVFLLAQTFAPTRHLIVHSKRRASPVQDLPNSYAGGIPLPLMGRETTILSTSLVDTFAQSILQAETTTRSSSGDRFGNPENPAEANFLTGFCWCTAERNSAATIAPDTKKPN
jgi:hypothetical protein